MLSSRIPSCSLIHKKLNGDQAQMQSHTSICIYTYRNFFLEQEPEANNLQVVVVPLLLTQLPTSSQVELVEGDADFFPFARHRRNDYCRLFIRSSCCSGGRGRCCLVHSCAFQLDPYLCGKREGRRVRVSTALNRVASTSALMRILADLT